MFGDPGHGCVGSSNAKISTSVSSLSILVLRLVESGVGFTVDVAEPTEEELLSPVLFPNIETFAITV